LVAGISRMEPVLQFPGRPVELPAGIPFGMP